MNTQLKTRPTRNTDIKTVTPKRRPQPVWTEPNERPTRGPALRLALILVVVATAGAAIWWALAGGSSTPAPDPAQTPAPAFDSPGGNSMRIPTRFVPEVGSLPFVSEFESPGGNSMRIPPLVVG